MSNRLFDFLAPTGLGLVCLAIGLSLFQLWQPVVGFFPPGIIPLEKVFGLLPATYFRPAHLAWVLVLGLFYYPLGEKIGQRLLDLFLAFAVVWSVFRILKFDYQSLDHLLYGLSTPDFLAGLVIVLVTLEVARRSVGLIMTLVGLTFILYSLYGNYLPDVIASKGFSLERMVRFQIFTNAGLFGAPLGIAAGAVFGFVLFGAFLQTTGAGKFLIDLSFALAGRYRGGPAKASVIASAAMGSISGSAIANTVTTGSLTIPMMKQLGYTPSQAGGIEASASTGGQIMPPIMGAGAFIMAEFTNTPYSEIVWMSLIPALLYFSSVLLYVHLMAVKAGFKAGKSAVSAWITIKEGVHFVLPLGLITWLLLQNYSPVLVGVSGCLAVVIASFLRSHTRVTLRGILDALKGGALLAVPISSACAVAGIVVGVIGQTGIGLQFTESVVSLSSGYLWLALLLVAIAALVLGMGLPATASYIVLSVMTGPALQELGLALITAHMIIFWLAQTSNVTPPIALAAFAGAGVAGAPPMKTAVEAFKLSNGLFVIPFLMAYTPLLFVEELAWFDVAGAAAGGFVLIIMLAVVLERFAFCRLSPLELFLVPVCIVLIVFPATYTKLFGAALAFGLMIFNWKRAT
ncbi:MAG: TRAP transporter permease [Candidatus Azotimanducaceae bacterium]